jgi:biopolymer transport protein ExbD
MAVQLRRSSALQAINLTPMIDCVFLLLIFFLVASRIADEEPQLDLSLPDISAALPATFQPQELIISVDAGGRYFVDGAFREIDEVRARIVTAHTNNPLTQSVIIRADRNASWQAVAEVMGICREAGIEQYSATMESEN